MPKLSALALGLLTLLGACAEPSEAERLTQALDPTTPIHQGLALCRTLSDPTQLGQCGVQVLDRKEDLGEGDCVALGQGVWLDECRFNVAERLAAHGVREQARLSVDEAPAIAEARVALFSAASIAPDAARLFWGERYRATQLLGRPADVAVCAALTNPAPCREAFSSMWDRAVQAVSQDQACARLSAGRPLLTMGNGEPSFVPAPETLAALLKACPAPSSP